MDKTLTPRHGTALQVVPAEPGWFVEEQWGSANGAVPMHSPITAWLNLYLEGRRSRYHIVPVLSRGYCSPEQFGHCAGHTRLHSLEECAGAFDDREVVS